MGKLDLNIPQLQLKKRQVPTEQIISTLGINPIAAGIDQAVPSLIAGFQKRDELRKSVMKNKFLMDIANGNADLTKIPKGIDSATMLTAQKMVADKTEKKQGIIALRQAEQSRGLPAGTLGDDPTTGRAIMAQMGSDERADKTTKRMFNLANTPNRPPSEFEMGIKKENQKNALVSKFNADASVKKAQQSIDSASTILDLVASGNPIAAAAVPTFAARMSGEVGNLSEADKRPFGGSQAILSRLEQTLTQAATGKLTLENARYVQQLSTLIKSRAQANIDSLAKTRAKQYKGENLTEEELYQTFNPNGGAGETPADRKARLLAELSNATH